METGKPRRTALDLSVSDITGVTGKSRRTALDISICGITGITGKQRWTVIHLSVPRYDTNIGIREGRV